VQRLRQGQAITSANLAQLKAIARRVRLRAGAGFANLADVYQAEAKVEGARDDLTRVEQQLDDAIDDFIRRTGAAPGRLEPASLSRSAMPESVAEAVRLAKQHSPAVLAVTYDAIAAAAGADVQAAALAPRLNLKLGLDYDPGVDGFSNENRGASALLMFKYDLFDGGTRKARARQSRLRARASAEDARDTRDAIEAEVRETWNAIQASGRRLTHLKARAKAARKSLDINLKRYEAGKASLDMLLDLQNEAATSEIAYLNEVSAGRYNACRILAATGGLLPALGLERWLAGAGR
jgi:adhesin transport system outer membrane protein